MSQRQQRLRDAIGMVPHHILLAGEVADDAADAESFDAFEVRLDGGRIFSSVAGQSLRREWRCVHDRVVEDGRAGVLVDALDVF